MSAVSQGRYHDLQPPQSDYYQRGVAIGAPRGPRVNILPGTKPMRPEPPFDGPDQYLENSRTRQLRHSDLEARPRRPLADPYYQQDPSVQWEPEQPGSQERCSALQYQQELGGYTTRPGITPQGADPMLESRQLPHPEAPYANLHWDPDNGADGNYLDLEQIGPKSRHTAVPAAAFSSEDGALLSRVRQQQYKSDRPEYRVGPGQTIDRAALGAQFDSMGDTAYRTGYMLDHNTGQVYETYEEDVMPPTTKSRITAQDLAHVNPKLISLNGNLNHHRPPPLRREVAPDPHGVYDGAPSQDQRQAMADIRRSEDRERIKRQLWHNRNDESYSLAEQDVPEIPAGMLGNHYYIRHQPYMPFQHRDGETAWRPGGDPSVSALVEGALPGGQEYAARENRGVSETGRSGTWSVDESQQIGALDRQAYQTPGHRRSTLQSRAGARQTDFAGTQSRLAHQEVSGNKHETWAEREANRQYADDVGAVWHVAEHDREQGHEEPNEWDGIREYEETSANFRAAEYDREEPHEETYDWDGPREYSEGGGNWRTGESDLLEQHEEFADPEGNARTYDTNISGNWRKAQREASRSVETLNDHTNVVLLPGVKNVDRLATREATSRRAQINNHNNSLTLPGVHNPDRLAAREQSARRAQINDHNNSLTLPGAHNPDRLAAREQSARRAQINDHHNSLTLPGLHNTDRLAAREQSNRRAQINEHNNSLTLPGLHNTDRLAAREQTAKRGGQFNDRQNYRDNLPLSHASSRYADNDKPTGGEGMYPNWAEVDALPGLSRVNPASASREASLRSDAHFGGGATQNRPALQGTTLRGAHASRTTRATGEHLGRAASADGHSGMGAGVDLLTGPEHVGRVEHRGKDERLVENASEMNAGGGEYPSREGGYQETLPYAIGVDNELEPDQRRGAEMSSQVPEAIRLMNYLSRSIG